MTTSQRKTKKIIIASFYTIFHLFFIGMIVFALWPAPPEEDPQVVINPDPIQVTETQVLRLDNGRADLIARISNPNDQYGVQQFRYQFILENRQGEQQQVSGTSYILPGNRDKFVLALNYDILDYQLIDFVIQDGYTWGELSRFDLPELIVRNVEVGPSTRAGEFFTAYAIVSNQSPYGLRTIDLVAVIEDNAGEVIAVNQTFVRDVMTGEAREFEMAWNENIPMSSIGRTSIYAYTNTLDQRQFILRETDGPVQQF